jgi:hypothetical protein
MKTRAFSVLALAVGFLIASAPALAHHGASAYDSKKLTTLKGTVTDFQFMNPHSEIFFEVKNADGKVDKWSAEAASMVTMSRLGWSKTLFKPGDQITVVGNCARNGSHTMRLSKVVLANGKEYGVQRGEDYADQ